MLLYWLDSIYMPACKFVQYILHSAASMPELVENQNDLKIKALKINRLIHQKK